MWLSGDYEQARLHCPKAPIYDLQAALVTTEMDRVNCYVGVYARVCANECVMGLFDWWGCYCQSIHHFSSSAFLVPSLLLFFTPSLSSCFDGVALPCCFLSPLDSCCSLFVTFVLSCYSLLLFVFLICAPLVPLPVLGSAKLRVQDGEWVQDGGVWPREPNGSWDRGEFLHTQAQTHFSTKTSVLVEKLLLLWFNSHWLMISSDYWTSPWPWFDTHSKTNLLSSQMAKNMQEV